MGDFNSGKNGSPIDNRLAGFAIGSVFVARLGGGCFLIENRKLRVVLVVGGGNRCQLGGNVDFAAKGVAINNTINNLCHNIYNRPVAHIGNRYVFVGYVIVSVVRPNSYGNAHESVAGSLNVRGVFFNGYGKNLGNFIVIKASLEAVCHDSAIGFPCICVVKLKLSNELAYACEVCNVDIHIVNGLRLRSFAGVVMSAKLDSGIARNCKGTNKPCRGAELVLYLKDYRVCARSEGNVTLRRESIACNSRLNLYAVNSDPSGRHIKRGIISYCCGECNVVAIYSRAIFKRNGSIGSRIRGICDRRKHSVVNSRAVVESKVIEVEGVNHRRGRLNISTDKRRFTVLILGRIYKRYVIICGKINTGIDPSGLRNVFFLSGIEVGFLSIGGGKVEMQLRTGGCSLFGIALINTQLHSKPCSALGNVNPHTEGCCLLSVCDVAKNLGAANIVDYVIRPVSKISVGVIKFEAKSILTVSYLTAVFQGSKERMSVNVL